uniref:Steroid 5-alpha reductase C-terminal domain-containing protein n=1 Tax=Callorhinchus milii TaxID=7868 RepID=A0A4W3GER2_CALMI
MKGLHDCNEKAVSAGCVALAALGGLCLQRQLRQSVAYGRYTPPSFSGILIPAKIAWFVQELPSFLVPVLLLYRSGSLETLGCKLLLFMFCGHYFHRYVSIILHRLELFCDPQKKKKRKILRSFAFNSCLLHSSTNTQSLHFAVKCCETLRDVSMM